MDPMFRDIRLDKSCLFWAEDTVAMSYAALIEVQRASFERAMAI